MSPMKIIYLALGVVLLLIGLVGLLFPIIPGILFIAVSLFLLGKASTRVRRFAESNEHLRRMNSRMEAMGEVPVFDRIRLGGWMVLESAVSAADSLSSGARRAIRRLRA